MDRKALPKLVLALAALLLVPALPLLLSAPGASGAGGDLSGKLGLAAGASFGTYAVLYLAGLLTAATPCVYPLIPVTLSIFGASRSASRGRAAGLSAIYVLGICTTYSSLGVAAALSGKAFGSALATGWVPLVMAALMFALAASMFGAFEIDLPDGLKARLSNVRGAGFAPAFLMGLLAGIIAAPCTGPVTAGVLTWVSRTQSASLGFWLLFTFALGLGTPFFVIGISSKKLPRSGPWMDTVKAVLGVALVLMGVGMLLPLLPKPHMLPVGPVPVMVGTGLFACAAVLAGAFTKSFYGDSREKLVKAAALAVLVLAVGVRFGWAGQPKSESRPIAWLHDEKAAIAEASRTGKPILVDFFAEWCAACKELDAHTFSDPEVRAVVADRFVPLKVDATDETDEVTRLTSKYGVPGLPTVLMFGCDQHGAPAPVAAPPPPAKEEPALASCAAPAEGSVGRLTGFEPPDKMLERLRQVQCSGDKC
jgi:thioredoxin:protein disulfide reductase